MINKNIENEQDQSKATKQEQPHRFRRDLNNIRIKRKQRDESNI
jgi:hypothetical protein